LISEATFIKEGFGLMVDLVILVFYHFSNMEFSIANFANISTLQGLALWERLRLVSAVRAVGFGAKLAILYILEAFVCVIAASTFTTLALLSGSLRA